ncbi:MAG: DUF3263 domain-containing protein [Rothia sp. (in: high G+C Gram-positive bacteria)]|nr:DUF3263 domain-containing protein [Rothia sp. (in: high G+C Gram-positive bacteria)]
MQAEEEHLGALGQFLPPPASDPTQEKIDPLTPEERAIITLEKKRFRYQGSKEQAIHKQLGLSAVAYYQRLNSMIDNPRIIQAEPVLIRHLREHRDALS